MIEDNIYSEYELVVGLEVHIQLKTKTKAFCGDPYEYGSPPNTQTSPISLAHPGTLPTFNKEALKMAMKLGIACGSKIHKESFFSRKNYFYADLPKGYQITQFVTPICTEGFVTIYPQNAPPRNIGLDKIICEEDSGKTIHDLDPFSSLIDLNRAGVPLIEIVSNPEIRQAEEAYYYLQQIRKMVRYYDICDGNMEEGSLRCDANVSVRKKGEQGYRQRVEIKNVNSMRNVQKAIEYEFKRQIDIYEQGGKIDMETLGFDAGKGVTYPMRSKELANDYRYFPEPDLPLFVVDEATIEEIRKSMPESPESIKDKLMKEHNLSEYDASLITAEKETIAFYLDCASLNQNYKQISNWISGSIRSYLNENALGFDAIPITPLQVSGLIQATDSNVISISVAQQKVFPYLLENPTSSVEEAINNLNLSQVSDDNALLPIIEEVLNANPAKVAEYKSGKKGLLGMFMGEVMKRTAGKADPKLTSKLLSDKLDA